MKPRLRRVSDAGTFRVSPACWRGKLPEEYAETDDEHNAAWASTLPFPPLPETLMPGLTYGVHPVRLRSRLRLRRSHPTLHSPRWNSLTNG